MRLSDLFKLVLDLFHGGLTAAEKSINQFNQSRPPHQRITPQVMWHLWAILGMLAVNYLVIVHVPQWSQFMSQQESKQKIENIQIQWSPEVWESTNLPSLMSNNELGNQFSHQIVDVEPVPINLHQIRRRINIPTHLRGLQSTTRVKLTVLVDEKGDYVRHRQSQHIYPDLAEVVSEQASKLSFLPALRNGKPVPYWVEVRFVFEL